MYDDRLRGETLSSLPLRSPCDSDPNADDDELSFPREALELAPGRCVPKGTSDVVELGVTPV